MGDYESKVIRKAIRFYGSVQGVGFRYRAVHATGAYGATGWVCNETDGSVSMEIQAPEAVIDKVIQSIERGSFIRIENLSVKSLPVIPEERSFHVRSHSDPKDF